MTFIVILYVFASEYLNPGSVELKFFRRISNEVWHALAKSFVSLLHAPPGDTERAIGQHPIGAMPSIPNFLAPILYKFCQFK